MAAEAIEEFDPIDYFQRFNRHGNFVCLRGAVRKGKTWETSIVTKGAINEDFAVMSNIKFEARVYKEYEGMLYYTCTDRQFFEAYIDCERDSILFLDDAQTYCNSMDAIKKRGQYMNDLMLFIGKFQSNCFFVAHEKYLPEFLKSQGTKHMYKFNYYYYYVSKRQKFNYIHNFHDEGDYLRQVGRRNVTKINITGQPLPYLTYMPTSFTFDLNIPDMWKELAQFEGRNLRDAVKEYLDKVDTKKKDEVWKDYTFRNMWKAIRDKRPNIDESKLKNMKIREIFSSDSLY